MSVPLRSERSRGLAGIQRDKASVEWPRREGGDPTDAWTAAMETDAKLTS